MEVAVVLLIFFSPRKISISNRMNTKSFPGAKLRKVGNQAIPPAINTRLFWAQEVSSTIEPQRRH